MKIHNGYKSASIEFDNGEQIFIDDLNLISREYYGMTTTYIHQFFCKMDKDERLEGELLSYDKRENDVPDFILKLAEDERVSIRKKF